MIATIETPNAIIAWCRLSDANPEQLTAPQLADVASLRLEKSQSERTAVYTLINYILGKFEQQPETTAEKAPAISAGELNICDRGDSKKISRDSQGVILGHFPSGAPYLRTPDGTPIELHISLTHSKEYAAVAIGTTPIGIDIEQFRPTLNRTRDFFLSRAEQRLLPSETQKTAAEAISPAEQATLAAWTAKEAAYKLAAAMAPDRHIRMFADLSIVSLTSTAENISFELQIQISDLGLCTFRTLLLTSSTALTFPVP